VAGFCTKLASTPGAGGVDSHLDPLRGSRPGLTSDERQQLKGLEREVRELRRANEILKAASAFLARSSIDLGFP
jgi:transposase-like protein